ncbi:GntR family transcriptional regulator [Brevibacillus borstelensis]|uniref:GntR family transcriptional regulator n=1 Tax=Brevibacillus borstelensis TaxID=45462 RepID=UPI0030BEE22F
MPLPPDLRRVERISAKNKVLQQLQTWIIDGTLQPGEKILDTELADAIGVSRTPVREALQILELQGFVEMQPGVETRVTRLGPADVPNIYRPLIALEALAAELVVPKITDTVLDKLTELNNQFAEAIETSQSFAAMELDEAFHKLIHETAGNTYISSFTALLHMHLRRLKFVFFQQFLPARASVEEHSVLIQALREKNVAASVQAMTQNWLRPMHEVTRQLENNEKETSHEKSND